MSEQIVNSDLDYDKLDRELSKVKTKFYAKPGGAFLMPLLSNMNFFWDSATPTACTNGLAIRFNPYWFLTLEPEARAFVLGHEIWHAALFHPNRMLRVRNEDEAQVVQYALDFCVNSILIQDGYTHPKLSALYHPRFTDMSPEDIYDILMDLRTNDPDEYERVMNYGSVSDSVHIGTDVKYPTAEEIAEVLGNTPVSTEDIASMLAQLMTQKVAHANQAYKYAAGSNPSSGGMILDTVLKRFLSPKLPWNQLLYTWMQELNDKRSSYARPNRRYSEVYMPSDIDDEEGGLSHLIYYMDVSASVSDSEVLRFNSEVKFVFECFTPKRMTIVLFDDKITDVIEFAESDSFDEIVITGRGGTSFVPVREHMLKHMPTAAIIFSDMGTAPMEPLPPGVNIPVLWVGVNAIEHPFKFGKVIHLRE